MTHIRNFLKRSSLLTSALLLILTWIVGDAAIFAQSASAAQITLRSLSINKSASGATADGQNVTYTFSFTLAGAASTVQSMDFQFCNNPLPGVDCAITSGQSVTGAALGTPTGLTGWSLGTAGNAPTNTWSNGASTTGGRIRITRTNATNVSSNTQVTIPFTGITNPTTANTTFYVRMVAYTDTGWTTSRDTGSVASATAQQIAITAKVQETLNFSVGSTLTDPSTTCAPFTDGGTIALGDATNGTLSFQQAYDAHSYFRVSTNANNGTLIYYSGDTLKSGSNQVNSSGLVAGGTSSKVGTSQFGLAIDSSDNATGGYSFTSLAANNGSNISGHLYDYSQGAGTIANNGTAKFQFDTASATTPDPIAIASSTITCDTGSVRYVGNISTTTPPGIYTTKISYLAVPTY